MKSYKVMRTSKITEFFFVDAESKKEAIKKVSLLNEMSDDSVLGRKKIYECEVAQ